MQAGEIRSGWQDDRKQTENEVGLEKRKSCRPDRTLIPQEGISSALTNPATTLNFYVAVTNCDWGIGVHIVYMLLASGG